ncbi:hypothetical protein D3C76_1203840 [compost metagenome]
MAFLAVRDRLQRNVYADVLPGTERRGKTGLYVFRGIGLFAAVPAVRSGQRSIGSRLRRILLQPLLELPLRAEECRQ